MNIFSELAFYSVSPNCKLAYTEIGSGSHTLLFLHGMGSNQKAWAKNIDELKDRFTCIALDLPGHGASDVLEEDYSIPKVAALVIDFIRAKKLEAVVLVGHSMGGHLSMEITRQAPELIEKLVLVAPAGLEVFLPQEIELIKQYFTADLISSYPKGMIRKNFEVNFYELPDDARFMIEDRYQLMEEQAKYHRFCETVAQSTLAIVGYNMMDHLEYIKQPVLVFFGKEDKLIPHHIIHPDKKIEDIAKGAIEKLPDASLVMYEACGHFVQWEKSAEVNKAITNFCQQ